MTVPIRKPRAALAVSLILVFVSGCSLLPARAAKSTFMLPAPELSPTGQPPAALTLRVLTPHADSPLNGTRILVNPEGQAIHAYGGARWSKPVPILARDHWIEGLRQTGGLKAIVNAASNATSDLSLSSDLTRFQISYLQGVPNVIIQVDAQILEEGSRNVVAARRFRTRQPIDDQPVESVIAGFGTASQTITEELVTWVLSVSRGL